MPTKILFLLILLFPRSGGATIRLAPIEAIEIVRQGCGEALRHVEAKRPYGPEILRGIIAERGLSGESAKEIMSYAEGELAKGRNPVYVGADVRLLYGFFDAPAPTQVPELFGRGHTAMRPVVMAKGDAPFHIFTMKEAGIAPRDATLRQTVDAFSELNVPLVLSDPGPFVAAQTQSLAADVEDATLVNPWDTRMFALRAATKALNRYAAAVFSGERKGLFFAAAINNVLFPETVVHEAAHAVQSSRWNFLTIVEYYRKQMKPRIDHAPRLFFPPPMVVSTHFKVWGRLFRNRVGDTYADAFFAKWNELGLTEMDYLFFSNLCELLAELDAHLQQGVLAAENGYLLPRLSTDVLMHLKRNYVGENGPIYPMGWDMALQNGPAPLFELVKTLNRAFRPR